MTNPLDTIQVKFVETTVHFFEVTRKELEANNIDPEAATDVMEYLEGRGKGVDFTMGEQVDSETTVTAFNSGE